MFKHLKDNPILIHQMRNARWPSVRTAMWIAVGLTLVGTVISLANFVQSPQASGGLVVSSAGLTLKSDSPVAIASSIILYFNSLVRSLLPWITVVTAGVTSAQVVENQAFQVMRLSQISERDIASGFIATAVYRLRGLWMVFGGLVIPYQVESIHSRVSIIYTLACLSGPCTSFILSEVLLQEIVFGLLFAICNTAYFIALYCFAAALGVWVAFRHREIGKTLAWSLIWLLLVWAVQAGIFRLVRWSSSFLTVDAASKFNFQKLLNIPTLLAIMGFYLVLGRASFKGAIRQMEHALE